MNEEILKNIFLLFYFLWSLFWKGIALWRAAHFKQRNWFIVMMIVNTVGILELTYLFRFAKKRLTWEEMKGWKNAFFEKEKVREKK